MPSINSNVAVLFFTRSAKAEGTSKKFIGDKDDRRNAHIARSLIRHTRNQILRSGLPVFEIDEKLQKGKSFGERFTNAFKHIFDKGYRYVIAVGNDTPTLKTGHIEKAGRLLSEGEADIVLGPAEDGGTWLMGYSRGAFEAHSFQQLPWKTPLLLEAILKQAGDDVSISQLASRADIDNYASLISFVETFRFNKFLLPLIHLIRGILAYLSDRFKQVSYQIPSSSAFSSLLLRAPPFTV